MSDNFSAGSVLSSYISTEAMFGDVLDVIPYCVDHEHVWSPRIATVILDACSQLDSLWKYEARQSPYLPKRQLSIKDYFEYYGEYLAPRWLVFWAEQPLRLQPFADWANLASYSRKDYQNLQWWVAYNKLKHNRITNRTFASLRNSILAVAGLFLAILRYKGCRTAVAQSGWLTGKAIEPAAILGEDSPGIKDNYVAAETRLFSYPVGWAGVRILPGAKWEGPASRRFRYWFDGFTTD